MSHPHAIYTDEENKATIGSHQLPVPMNWKVLVQPNEPKKETKGINRNQKRRRAEENKRLLETILKNPIVGYSNKESFVRHNSKESKCPIQY